MLIIGDSHTSKLSYTIKDYFKTKGITECSEYSNNKTYVEYEIVKNIENDKEIILSKKINSELSRAPIIVDNKILILNRSSQLITVN